MRVVILSLAFFLFVVLFTSCTQSFNNDVDITSDNTYVNLHHSADHTEDSQTVTTEIYVESSVTAHDVNNLIESEFITIDEYHEEPPPDNELVFLNSYTELISALNYWSTLDDSAVKQVTISDISDEKANQTYLQFAKYRKMNNTVLIPQTIDRSNILQTNENDPRKIILFANEQYGKPWIWYYCTVDGIELIIKTMYIDDASLLKEIQSNDISWLRRQLVPNAANEDNYESSKLFEKIELIETEYENGISKILVSKERDFPRRHYEFIYNNVLISVQSDEIDLFDTDVLAKLTFVEYKLN